MTPTSRQCCLTVAIATVFLLAGCAQISVHSSVTADGTIEEYRLQINTSREVYGFLEQAAEDEGYDSFRESIVSDFDEERAETIEYDEAFDGDEVTVTITATDVEPGPDSGISITEDGDTLIYEDRTFLNETARGEPETEMQRTIMSTVSVDYYLTMPGEIVDSNADVVDGNTAEWHESGSDAFFDNRIYAQSETPTFGAVPGFGLGVAIIAVALLAMGGAVRSRRAR